MNKLMFAGLALAAVLAVNTGSGFAAESAAAKACSDQWDAMKAANKIPAGQTKKEFDKACMAQSAAPAAPAAPAAAAKPMAPAAPAAAAKPMAPAAPAAAAKPMAPAAPAAAAAAPAAGGSDAEHKREATCSAQWKAMKANNTRPAGMKWPEFWHDCDTKLKAAGQ